MQCIPGMEFNVCSPEVLAIGKFLIKHFPIWCNVDFGSVFRFIFCIVYCSENRLKINITPYWEICITFTEIKFKIWRVTFFKSFLTGGNYGTDFWFSGNSGNMTGRPAVVLCVNILGFHVFYSPP